MKDTTRSIVVIVLAALLLAGGFLAMVKPEAPSPQGVLPTFSDYGQIESFLSSSQKRGQDVYAANMAEGGAVPSEAVRYSTTNVQVNGVDEADSVKTDGQYLYVSAWDAIYIVKAYPPEQLANVSKIKLNESLGIGANQSVWISGLYVFPGKLVVIASISGQYYGQREGVMMPTILSMPEQRVVVAVFDLGDIQHPFLKSSFSISGSLNTSRLTNGTVYVVAQHFSWLYYDSLVRPQVWEGSTAKELEANKVHYDPQVKDGSSFLNILAVDLAQESFDYTSIIAGYSSIVYMSQDALYLTFQKWSSPVVWSSDGSKVEVASSSTDTSHTTIYKLTVEGLKVTPVGTGDVAGWPSNQFSLDERDGFLRVATTSGWTESSSSVFILDSQLKVVGHLGDIAPGERIYSSRFVGDTLYLVTFRQVDPLFVIDLSDRSQPRIMGELKVPGFSSYLHPIDPGHLVGIGMLNGSVKLSLFDVTNVSSPQEVASLIIPGWSHSEALWDHKAVLFDQISGKLVIPITSYNSTSWNMSSAAYVFQVSNRSLVLQGTVRMAEGEYLMRSHYIGDYLYSVSDSIVHVNQMSDLVNVGSLKYAEPRAQYFGLLMGAGDVVAIEKMG